MAVFFRLINQDTKENSLLNSIRSFRKGEEDELSYIVDSKSFSNVPGTPFSYWISPSVIGNYKNHPSLNSSLRAACVTNPAGDDTRYFRLWWEVVNSNKEVRWINFSKGGSFSKFYNDLHLMVLWDFEKASYHGFIGTEHRPLEKPASLDKFFRPGLTWPRRTNGLSFRVLPKGSIFADKGPAVFNNVDDISDLQAVNAVANSAAFNYLLSAQLARTELAQSFEVGLVNKVPIPLLSDSAERYLADSANDICVYKRILDEVVETSHAFILPEVLLCRIKEFDRGNIHLFIKKKEVEIDEYCFELYGFKDIDKQRAREQLKTTSSSVVLKDEENFFSMVSWGVGVAFGVFDWKHALLERDIKIVEDPFAPLPDKSPGMLPEGATPYHGSKGILIDEFGHEDDLATLVTSVFNDVGYEFGENVRTYLKRSFFQFHLKEYSKSRRQAPIYWPFQTLNSSFTLWVNYRSINGQTLYSCVNDYIDKKLEIIAEEIVQIRGEVNRSSIESERLEKLEVSLSEIKDMRDEMLRLASFWAPNFNDGVQISAAPLWRLFQSSTWRNKLKTTWEELEQGKYDWSAMAYNIWPERVLRKSYEDRSIAIAHDVEAELWENVEVAVGKSSKTKLVWRPRKFTKAELDCYIQNKIAKG